jgi:hypothetical protein
MRSIIICFVVLAGFCVTGCDPVCRTTQQVTLLVRERATQEVVPDAMVALIPASTDSNQSTNIRERLNEQEQDKGISDAQGKATVTLTLGYGVCSGLLAPKPKDTLSGSDYMVWVRGKSGDETLQVAMKPGNTASGNTFVVELTAIGEAKEGPPPG